MYQLSRDTTTQETDTRGEEAECHVMISRDVQCEERVLDYLRGVRYYCIPGIVRNL